MSRFLEWVYLSFRFHGIFFQNQSIYHQPDLVVYWGTVYGAIPTGELVATPFTVRDVKVMIDMGILRQKVVRL